jgi:hypothetical protein
MKDFEISVIKNNVVMPHLAIVGEHGSGKTEALKQLVDEKLSSIFRTNRMTRVPMTVIMSDSIGNGKIGLQLKLKEFPVIVLHERIVEELFNSIRNYGTLQATVENIDTNFFNRVLIPRDNSYNLGILSDVCNASRLRAVLYPLAVDYDKNKGEYKHLPKEPDKFIRNLLIFDNVLVDADDKVGKNYWEFLNKLGDITNRRFKDLVGEELAAGEIVSISFEDLDLIRDITTENSLFSSIVEEIKLACRPRQEFLNLIQWKNFNLAVTDTVWLANEDIKNNIESSLRFSPDKVVVLLNANDSYQKNQSLLAEIEDKKEELKRKYDSDLKIEAIFNKLDIRLENELMTDFPGQKDSEGNATSVELDLIADIAFNESYRVGAEEILTLRFKDYSYLFRNWKDYAQLQPKGFYVYIEKTVSEFYKNSVKVAIKVVNPLKPAVTVKLNLPLEDLDELKYALTEDKPTVNGYTLDLCIYPFLSKDVADYYTKIKNGLGFRAPKRISTGSFSINMRGLIRLCLKTSLPIKGLIKAADFDFSNITDSGFDNEDVLIREVSYGINPENIYDSVACNLLRSDDFIEILSKFNRDWGSYDNKIKSLQNEFKKYFGSNKFLHCVVVELESALTKALCKLLVNKDYLPGGKIDSMDSFSKFEDNHLDDMNTFF